MVSLWLHIGLSRSKFAQSGVSLHGRTDRSSKNQRTSWVKNSSRTPPGLDARIATVAYTVLWGQLKTKKPRSRLANDDGFGLTEKTDDPHC